MITKRSQTLALFLATALLVAPAALAQDEIIATVHIAGSGEDQQMTVTSSGESVRIDMQSPQGGAMSMVWTGGVMRMIMHSERMYMEFTEEMMERMRSMMGNMPGMPGGEETPTFDPDDITRVTFEETGNTETINGMSAYEVLATSADGNTASLWMTDATDVGLMEVMLRLSSALSNLVPMGPGMQQGGGGMGNMRDFSALARAQGLPDDRVIRIHDQDSGTIITLGDVSGGPVPAGTWEAPEGYTRQQMPFGD